MNLEKCKVILGALPDGAQGTVTVAKQRLVVVLRKRDYVQWVQSAPYKVAEYFALVKEGEKVVYLRAIRAA